MRLDSHANPSGTRSQLLSERRSARRRTALVLTTVTLGITLSAAGVWALTDGFSTGGSTGKSPAAVDRGPEAAEAAPPATAPSAAASSVAAETTAPALPSRTPTITVAGVGDMLFDRQVKALIRKEGGEAPLARVAARLSRADVTVGNLETTLAEGGTRNPVKEPKYAFRGHPDGIMGLRLAGFDAVSLANNHMLDYGWKPLGDTIASLDAAGIGHAGSGEDSDAAWTPATIETSSGATVAYLAFSHVVPVGFLATDDRPGVASGKRDVGLVKKAVRKAKRSHDYVIVSFHWGIEYEDDANADQVKKARQAIDAGADMVLAHHPHVIQGIEFYKGRLIAYSLGDFVFDHYSRKTGEAFILEADLGPDGTQSAVAVPVYLDSYGRPEFVEGAHAKEILIRLRKISARHGTAVVIDGSLARIQP